MTSSEKSMIDRARAVAMGLADDEEAVRWVIRKLESFESETSRLIQECARTENEIQQILGQALGFPKFCDDPVNFPGTTSADGVCVGDHVAVTLARKAAEEIENRRRDLLDFQDTVKLTYAEGCNNSIDDGPGSFRYSDISDGVVDSQLAKTRQLRKRDHTT